MDYQLVFHTDKQPDNGLIQPESDPDPWDAYTLQDEVFLEYWDDLVSSYAEFTFYLCDEGDEIVVSATCVPLRFDEPLEQLPDGGWRWAIKTAMQQYEQVTPNLLCALGIHVEQPYRGSGLSKIALQTMIDLAKKYQLPHLIAPVRPSQKHEFPQIPMSDYIQWTQEDGLSHDAWIRTHQRIGGKIIKVAAESMKVAGSIFEWQKWTTLHFPTSGEYTVPGGLTTATIDLMQNRGVYIEPNVWMAHTIQIP